MLVKHVLLHDSSAHQALPLKSEIWNSPSVNQRTRSKIRLTLLFLHLLTRKPPRHYCSAKEFFINCLFVRDTSHGVAFLTPHCDVDRTLCSDRFGHSIYSSLLL
jgi:hypothetical protein